MQLAAAGHVYMRHGEVSQRVPYDVWTVHSLRYFRPGPFTDVDSDSCEIDEAKWASIIPSLDPWESTARKIYNAFENHTLGHFPSLPVYLHTIDVLFNREDLNVFNILNLRKILPNSSHQYKTRELVRALTFNGGVSTRSIALHFGNFTKEDSSGERVYHYLIHIEFCLGDSRRVPCPEEVVQQADRWPLTFIYPERRQCIAGSYECVAGEYECCTVHE